MSELQKVIKYCAIAFAIFLTVSIIGGIVTAILAITGTFSGTFSGTLTGGSSVTTEDFNQGFDDVKGISIEHGIGTLTIKEGTSDKVEVAGQNVSENFTAERNFSGNLNIRDKHNFLNWINFGNFNGNKTSLTIYLPKDFIAENFVISGGAGNVFIETLKTNKLEIDAGAGNINGENIFAGKVRLNGGVGEIKLNGIDFTDADIDSGVGNIQLEGYLKGKNSIDCGVGETELNLIGSTDDYNIKVDKGVGNIHINGDKYSDINWNNMTAPNSLDIDGGVGNIDINFK